MSLLPYLGGEDFLRYVLKDKDTGEVYFVVVLSLVAKEEESSESDSDTESEGEVKSDKRIEKTTEKDDDQTNADDVD